MDLPEPDFDESPWNDPVFDPTRPAEPTLH